MIEEVGHPGEKFYSMAHGEVYLKSTNHEITVCHGYRESKVNTGYMEFSGDIANPFDSLILVDQVILIDEDGKFLPNGDCILFPSRYQKDWAVWYNERKNKKETKTEKKSVLDKVLDWIFDLL